MGLLYSSRRALLGGAKKEITWLLRDDFTTDLAAGSVNGTAAEPGPGTRGVVDPAVAGYIQNGQFWMPPSVGDIRLHYNDAAFSPDAQPGRISLMQFEGQGRLGGYFGWDNAATGDINRWATRLNANDVHCYINAVLRAKPDGYAVLPVGQMWTIWWIPRTTGCHWFMDTPNTPYPWLCHVNRDTAAAAYNWIGCNQIGNTDDWSIHTIRQADDDWLWLPAPIASDSFDRANGAMGNTDGAGHQESGADPLMGGGGDGVAWTDSIGTTQINANEASASALVGGIAMATVDPGIPDISMICELATHVGGNIGLVFRYTDSNNYAIAYMDGANLVIDEVVGGVLNNLASYVVAWVANEDMFISVTGQQISLTWRTTYISPINTLHASLTGTRCGLYSTNVGNFHDDFVCYAAGWDNQYSKLSEYSA